MHKDCQNWGFNRLGWNREQLQMQVTSGTEMPSGWVNKVDQEVSGSIPSNTTAEHLGKT